MTPRKRELKATPPQSRSSRIMDAVNKNADADKLKVVTASRIMDNWRYIDFVDPITKFPALIFEFLFGCRGLLAGRMMKVEADEGVGKSSLSFLLYAMAQQTVKAICTHYETEGAPPPPDYIASFGCDTSDLLITRPTSIVDCFGEIERQVGIIRKDIDPAKEFPILLGIDSISGLASEADPTDEGEESITNLTGNKGISVHARAISKWFREKTGWMENNLVTMLAIAQYREKIDTGMKSFIPVPPEQKKTTIAARALNYHASYRLALRSSPLKVDGKDVGEHLTMKSVKNKLSPRNREVTIDLIRDHGFDLVTPTVDWLRVMSPWPLAGGGVFKIEQAGPRIKSPNLSDKTFASSPEGKLELLGKLYENKDLLMALREGMRIRGFGFDFEQNYVPSKEEIEDATEGTEGAETPPPAEAPKGA